MVGRFSGGTGTELRLLCAAAKMVTSILIKAFDAALSGGDQPTGGALAVQHEGRHCLRHCGATLTEAAASRWESRRGRCSGCGEVQPFVTGRTSVRGGGSGGTWDASVPRG